MKEYLKLIGLHYRTIITSESLKKQDKK